MADTNPLDTLRIKKLAGFKQITPGVITGNVINALKQCGIDAVTSITEGRSEYSIGNMNVLGNTFYGLKMDSPTSKSVGSATLHSWSVQDLIDHSVQTGIRLTQSGYSGSVKDLSLLMMYQKSSNSSTDFKPQIAFQGEDSSLYWELVISAQKAYGTSYSVYVDAYVNKQKVSSCAITALSLGYVISLRIGPYVSVAPGNPLTLVAGDIYTAELDYNSDGTVTPQLLGNLTLEPFTVATYSGDKHSNTKNQDIVTALNTLDPNNDLGALAIKPVEQPASVTFNAPDIAGKSIYGASLNIVYKDSIAPNNRLSYQITEGTTQLPAETITTRNADITGYTTFSKILTTPANGGDWNAENLKFKLDLFNKGAE
ncbi:hypothetical protein ABGY98_003614 [Salmonella enterica]|uniref:Uncharacterized protein n=1 Tax=Salmonella enterica subsp. diarizonae serovar 48:i:z TaxID=1192842 RepID=A0A7U5YJ24_SALDZ|nr:hypothetical protein [Salmonella enterica]EAA4452009.1 hypothetical protein [Salmonella enterica subsp. diarizonae]EDW6116911.1 hypothetical protein [Salmonella enterica subsp. salamae]AXC73843.1 hypothetical protein DOE59_21150 [Salmonella enterica subsp. diarizonae serovar 48:i:z]EAM2673022.1 hypothetical protein [Salmonella enterica]EAM6404575.1 hypothetical protein [Salmonella enterica]